MAHGFFTVERWTKTQSEDGTWHEGWKALRHYDGTRTLSEAIYSVTEGDEPGFYRVIQTQRMIAVRKTSVGSVRSERFHVMSAEALEISAQAYGAVSEDGAVGAEKGKPNGSAR